MGCCVKALTFDLRRSPQLTEQLDGAGIATRSECLRATDSKDCDCAQECAELTRCAWIEAAVSAMGCERDVSEHVFDLAVAPFLEHESRHAEASELASFRNEDVGVLLASITDEDQGAHLEQLGFLPGAWVRILPIWVWPASHMICDMVLASCWGSEIQREARHSPRPR